MATFSASPSCPGGLPRSLPEEKHSGSIEVNGAGFCSDGGCSFEQGNLTATASTLKCQINRGLEKFPNVNKLGGGQNKQRVGI